MQWLPSVFVKSDFDDLKQSMKDCYVNLTLIEYYTYIKTLKIVDRSFVPQKMQVGVLYLSQQEDGIYNYSFCTTDRNKHAIGNCHELNLEALDLKKLQQALQSPFSNHSKLIDKQTENRIVQAVLAKARSQNTEPMDVNKTECQLNDIFKIDNILSGKRVLIKGEAGIGKSTLCHKLCYEWANGRWGKEYQAVFWIPLRALLVHKEKTENKDFHINQIISQIIQERCLGSYEEFEKTINTLEQQKSFKILWLLDGYDEIIADMQSENIIEKLINEFFSKTEKKHADILLTSRPDGISESKIFHRTFENNGFNDNNIKVFISTYGNYLRDKNSQTKLTTEKGEELLNFLEKRPQLWEIAHVPINLKLLVSTYENQLNIGNSKNLLSQTMLTTTQLYEEMMWELLRYGLIKNKVCSSTELKYEEKCKNELACLEEMAYESREELQVSPQIISQVRTKPRTEFMIKDFKQLCRFGLLRPIVKNEDCLKSTYEFIHKTFQEFLAARYICKLLSYEKNDQRYQDGCEFIKNQKYNPFFANVFKFLAGLISVLSKTPAIINDYWNLLSAQSLDVITPNRMKLLLYSLNEAIADGKIDERINHKDKIKDKIIAKINQSLNKSDAWLLWDLLPILAKCTNLVLSFLNKIKELNIIKNEPTYFLSYAKYLSITEEWIPLLETWLQQEETKEETIKFLPLIAEKLEIKQLQKLLNLAFFEEKSSLFNTYAKEKAFIEGLLSLSGKIENEVIISWLMKIFKKTNWELEEFLLKNFPKLIKKIGSEQLVICIPQLLNIENYKIKIAIIKMLPNFIEKYENRIVEWLNTASVKKGEIEDDFVNNAYMDSLFLIIKKTNNHQFEKLINELTFDTSSKELNWIRNILLLLLDKNDECIDKQRILEYLTELALKIDNNEEITFHGGSVFKSKADVITMIIICLAVAVIETLEGEELLKWIISALGNNNDAIKTVALIILSPDIEELLGLFIKFQRPDFLKQSLELEIQEDQSIKLKLQEEIFIFNEKNQESILELLANIAIEKLTNEALQKWLTYVFENRNCQLKIPVLGALSTAIKKLEKNQVVKWLCQSLQLGSEEDRLRRCTLFNLLELIKSFNGEQLAELLSLLIKLGSQNSSLTELFDEKIDNKYDVAFKVFKYFFEHAIVKNIKKKQIALWLWQALTYDEKNKSNILMNNLCFSSNKELIGSVCLQQLSVEESILIQKYVLKALPDFALELSKSSFQPLLKDWLELALTQQDTFSYTAWEILPVLASEFKAAQLTDWLLLNWSRRMVSEILPQIRVYVDYEKCWQWCVQRAKEQFAEHEERFNFTPFVIKLIPISPPDFLEKQLQEKSAREFKQIMSKRSASDVFEIDLENYLKEPSKINIWNWLLSYMHLTQCNPWVIAHYISKLLTTQEKLEECLSTLNPIVMPETRRLLMQAYVSAFWRNNVNLTLDISKTEITGVVISRNRYQPFKLPHSRNVDLNMAAFIHGFLEHSEEHQDPFNQEALEHWKEWLLENTRNLETEKTHNNQIILDSQKNMPVTEKININKQNLPENSNENKIKLLRSQIKLQDKKNITKTPKECHKKSIKKKYNHHTIYCLKFKKNSKKKDIKNIVSSLLNVGFYSEKSKRKNKEPILLVDISASNIVLSKNN